MKTRMQEMVKKHISEKSIIIGDRLFANYAIYETINRMQIWIILSERGIITPQKRKTADDGTRCR